MRAGPLVFVEDIVAFEPPRDFANVILSLHSSGGPALPIRHGRGCIDVARDGRGTHVDWCSRFEVTVPLVATGSDAGRPRRPRHPRGPDPPPSTDADVPSDPLPSGAALVARSPDGICGQRATPRASGYHGPDTMQACMRDVRVTQRFETTPEVAFARVSDHAWFLSLGAMRCRLQQEGQRDRDGVGAVREIVSGGLRFVEDIVAFEPPRHFAYVIRTLEFSGGRTLPLRHERGWIDVEAHDGGALATWTTRFGITIPAIGHWMLEPLVDRQLRHAFGRALARAARGGPER